MDPLTHTATGLFLSRAGLRRWSPLATPILMLAANAPDADIVTAAGGSLSYLHYHRHLTHSLLLAPVMALLPVVVVRLVARKPVQWLGAWAAALIAVGTHLLLDWTNVYGIRLLLPFSARWLRLDIASVIDPWIWTILFLGIAAPFLGRLVGSEIASGAHRPKHYGRGAAWFSLLCLLAYDGGRAVLHQRAVATLDSRIYDGAAPQRVAAMPDAINPWRWRGVIETADFYAVEDFQLGGEFDPGRASIFHKPDPDPALDVAARTPEFVEFLRFTQFPLWRISPAPEPEGAKIVEVIDMRFGTPLSPGFMAGAVVTNRLQALDVFFRFGRLKPR